jgi:hypothetical protein
VHLAAAEVVDLALADSGVLEVEVLEEVVVVEVGKIVNLYKKSQLLF